jgi:hypothetical protein
MLRGLDVEAAIVASMPEGQARGMMFSDAAIAASHQAERLGVGPYPLGFLAGCVRSLGLRGALELPEPLIGAEPTALVRRWMSAAEGAECDIERDRLFAWWLERVALLIAVRRQVDAAGSSTGDAVDPVDKPDTSPAEHRTAAHGQPTPDAV